MKSNKLYITGVLLAAMLLGVNSSYSMEKPETAKITIEDLLAYRDNPAKIFGKVADKNLLKDYFKLNESKDYNFELGELVVAPRNAKDPSTNQPLLTYGFITKADKKTREKGGVRVKVDFGGERGIYPQELYVFKEYMRGNPEEVLIQGENIGDSGAFSLANFAKNNEFKLGELVVVPLLQGLAVDDENSFETTRNFLVGKIAGDKTNGKYKVQVNEKQYSVKPEFLGKIKK